MPSSSPNRKLPDATEPPKPRRQRPHFHSLRGCSGPVISGRLATHFWNHDKSVPSTMACNRHCLAPAAFDREFPGTEGMEPQFWGLPVGRVALPVSAHRGSSRPSMVARRGEQADHDIVRDFRRPPHVGVARDPGERIATLTSPVAALGEAGWVSRVGLTTKGCGPPFLFDNQTGLVGCL